MEKNWQTKDKWLVHDVGSNKGKTKIGNKKKTAEEILNRNKVR